MYIHCHNNNFNNFPFTDANKLHCMLSERATKKIKWDAIKKMQIIDDSNNEPTRVGCNTVCTKMKDAQAKNARHTMRALIRTFDAHNFA